MSKHQTYSIFVLLVFHAIGFYLFTDIKGGSSLTYINMILCAAVIFFAEKDRSVFPLIGIFLGGFLIELIGVKTGLLFGAYSYDHALGYKLLGVPLVIGLNWYCIVVSSASIAMLIKTNAIIRALIAALLCTLMDVLIEPVAINYGFWSWFGVQIPIYNYFCWFIFSLIFTLLYLHYSKRRTPTSTALYLLWVIFFSVLNLI
ncbi:carotenoid biosynthesis protein [Crocinitomicaceae bacterium]|nr:carotenoid biosynthesis protein [Crocinitomicaceae bacterium]